MMHNVFGRGIRRGKRPRTLISFRHGYHGKTVHFVQAGRLKPLNKKAFRLSQVNVERVTLFVRSCFVIS